MIARARTDAREGAMTIDHDDDARIGRLLARRELLALFGTTAGAAALATCVPGRFGRRMPFGAATAVAAEPSCIVRPELTEGPYFVDERLNRSDIRSDPTTGEVRPGVTLTLAFVVSRIDGSSCAPFEGALVDLWHCDATGIYSDVQDAGFDTTGQQFLRGYQVTDADGAARFITIYPGWYQGRTVHMHFKIRTDPDSTTGLEFTSQLFFDDDVTDVVHAEQPYASKGQRTLRNAGDGIYQDGGDQLLLSLTSDDAGGYTATFEIGIEASGTTTSTTTPASGTTTTTLAGASCATTAACLAQLHAALPNPATAASQRAKRTAQGLRRRAGKLASVLERAAAASGSRQQRLLTRAEAKLGGLLAASERAATKGTLGVSLAPIQAAIEALLDLT
jgi:protocatechuate 3,4-dioxygenase beta subunit